MLIELAKSENSPAWNGTKHPAAIFFTSALKDSSQGVSL